LYPLKRRIELKKTTQIMLHQELIDRSLFFYPNYKVFFCGVFLISLSISIIEMTAKKNNTSKKIIGYAMYVVAFAMPLSHVPGVLNLYQTRVTTGLSLDTWVIYFIGGLVPFAYAISNRIKPLIISNILWVTIDALMLYGIIKFGVLSGNSSFERLLLFNNIGKTLAGLGLIALSTAAILFGYDLINTPRKGKK
jgi:uncharacterized protein with PQ loop repeat